MDEHLMPIAVDDIPEAPQRPKSLYRQLVQEFLDTAAPACELDWKRIWPDKTAMQVYQAFSAFRTDPARRAQPGWSLIKRGERLFLARADVAVHIETATAERR